VPGPAPSLAATVSATAAAADALAPFYVWLRDVSDSALRGVLPGQAYDTWHAFVHAMVVPMANVSLVRSVRKCIRLEPSCYTCCPDCS
jgi:hypothetical protein